ncbi:Rieske 2Fe-2S domain-containing protein [Caulobacter sp. S45]|jgi:nitrite reductase (NADH) small subunit|uniref:Rieske (2Fe-2S) protein n=1 Tax=Caulobacter sp. S45 TaxID=1641861 RepID=UPI00131B4236|nr:Rieske 2Fe-2S domain-containing protein [Caulobacter sp. S45]
MPEYKVGPADIFADDERRIVACDDKEIGIFKLDGEFYGWHNLCPHQGGPVCTGRVMSRVLEIADAEGCTRGQQYDDSQKHIVCPWHGYEFSIKTGSHPGNARVRLRPADVFVREGQVYVRL